MQKCSLSREKKGEKGSTPKCNIPRRQMISSEIEITFIEIRNALKKSLISADTSIFHGRRADILWKREERSNTLSTKKKKDAVNFSRYFYTNLYLAITDRFFSFLAIEREKGVRIFCFSRLFLIVTVLLLRRLVVSVFFFFLGWIVREGGGRKNPFSVKKIVDFRLLSCSCLRIGVLCRSIAELRRLCDKRNIFMRF